MRKISSLFLPSLLVVLIWSGISGSPARAALVDELQSKIESHNQKIKQLEQEIAAYQKSLNQTSAQASTLQGELARLTTEAKKLKADIQVTENKIDRTALTIKQLTLAIGDKDKTINNHQDSLRANLRTLRQLGEENLLEVLLARGNFGDFVAEENRLANLEGAVTREILSLRDLKVELSDQKTETET